MPGMGTGSVGRESAVEAYRPLARLHMTRGASAGRSFFWPEPQALTEVPGLPLSPVLWPLALAHSIFGTCYCDNRHPGRPTIWKLQGDLGPCLVFCHCA